MLWCSTTPSQADQARRHDLADTATTLTEAHQKVRDGEWHLPPGSLLVVDDAATAEPTVIAELADHAASTNAGLILLDTEARHWPPRPSTRLLTLLHTELPWATLLTAEPADAQNTRPDLDPVLTQTGRLHKDLLTDEMRDALQSRDQIRAANTAAHQRHLTVTRMRYRRRGPGLDHARDTGIDI